MEFSWILDILKSPLFLLFLPIIGYFCHRNVYDFNDLEDAIDSTGTNEAEILIPNQQDITDDLTIPANITLRFIQGGTLNISAGKTVTINGYVDAGLYQIFEGTGLVSFGSGSTTEIYPEWWGIDGTADEVQINQSIDSLSFGGVVKLAATTYLIAAPIVVATEANLIGAGINKTIIEQVAEDDLINIGVGVAAEYIKVKGMKLEGLNGEGIGVEIGANGEHIIVEEVYCTTAEFGFDTKGKNVTFRDCEAYDNGNDTSNDGDGFVADDASENTLFDNCESSYHTRTASNGFECEDAAINITFKDCVAHHNEKAGFNPHTHNGNNENVLIEGCYSYNNGDQGLNNSGSDYVIAKGCFFYDNAESGVYSVADLLLKNCHIYGNGTATTFHGVQIAPGTQKTIIEGCQIHHIAQLAIGTNSGAIYASAISFLSVKNCIITGNYGINIYQQIETMNVIIEGNRIIGDISEGNGNGIYVNNATAGTDKSILIANNVITDFGLNGIRLTQGKNIIISGNRIYDNTTASINCAGAATINVQIVNNNMQAGTSLSPSYLLLNTIDEVLVGVPTKLTVNAGAITVIKNYHLVDGQGDANDDLDTINGGHDGMELTLQAEDDAVTITIRDNSVGGGNIELEGNASIVLDTVKDKAYLLYDGTNSIWCEKSRFTG